MGKIINFCGIITCMSPLSHNSDMNLGVDTKFRRIKYYTEYGTEDLPVYSGNAFRGILRRIAARDFLEHLGIEKVSDKLYYCFFCGGALEKGSHQDKIAVGLKREMRENIPWLSLFGTAYSNQMLAGKLKVGQGIPLATETQGFTGIKIERSIWDLLCEVFYTRRDDLEDKGNPSEKEQMKYQIECLAPGAVLQHEFTLENPNEIEVSCFGAIIRKFLENPILGGKSGAGHGKVKLNYKPEWPEAGPYYDFLSQNKEKIVAYVKGMEKEKPGEKKKKGKNEEIEEDLPL